MASSSATGKAPEANDTIAAVISMVPFVEIAVENHAANMASGLFMF
jgi:hypothetical protein